MHHREHQDSDYWPQNQKVIYRISTEYKVRDTPAAIHWLDTNVKTTNETHSNQLKRGLK